MNFFVEHIWEIIFGLIASGALGFCKYLHSQSKKYKILLDEKDNENLRTTIQDELEPIIEEIHRIETRIKACEDNEKNHIDMLLTSYKFRLIQLCRTYLRQEYMTQDQFDQLTEFFKLYKGLGGNGQAKEYYEKACELPIHDED
jgi:hypothetical protein